MYIEVAEAGNSNVHTESFESADNTTVKENDGNKSVSDIPIILLTVIVISLSITIAILLLYIIRGKYQKAAVESHASKKIHVFDSVSVTQPCDASCNSQSRGPIMSDLNKTTNYLQL